MRFLRLSPAVLRPSARLLAVIALPLLLLAACGGPAGGSGPAVLRVSPAEGPPGTVLRVSGLEAVVEADASAALEVFVGGRPAAARVAADGALAVAVPVFALADGWPVPPEGPQDVEVRRGERVLGRAEAVLRVTELPRAPGTTRAVADAYRDLVRGYERVWGQVPVELPQEAPLREAVLGMLDALLDDGENSLAAVLDGSAPALAGEAPDPALVDALLASSGALEQLRARTPAPEGATGAEATGSAELRPLGLGGLCDGDGDDVILACKMQIHAVLDDYTRTVVQPTAKTYANTVGLAMGTAAMVASGGAVPAAHAIITAILSLTDFIASKVVPALLPSRLTVFELELERNPIGVGETAPARVTVGAANTPPPISYFDVFEQIYVLWGLKDVTKAGDDVIPVSVAEFLESAAKFAFELFSGVLKDYEAEHPGSFPFLGEGDLSLPSLSWGPVLIEDPRLVELFSYDEGVARPLEDSLAWEGVDLGEATVRAMPRGAGRKAQILVDRALCLACAYRGGAFGHESRAAQARLRVGEAALRAAPASGVAPLVTEFSWTVPEGDAPPACTLDPGDGSPLRAIDDCAATTSLTHTYAHASALSALATDGGAYRAVLYVDGVELAATEVAVDWAFSATPASGAAPLEVAFAWRGLDPAEAPSCTFDPGDGSGARLLPDCASAPATRHVYEEAGSFVPSLVVRGPRGEAVKTALVEPGGGGCEALEGVEAWRGTLSYSYRRDVQNDSRHAIVSVDVELTGLLTESQRNEAGTSVSYRDAAPGGHIAVSGEHHSHGEEHDVYQTFQGSGPPLPAPTPSGQGGSAMFLSVFADCSYTFHVQALVPVRGVSYGDPYEGTFGVPPVSGRLDGAGGFGGSAPAAGLRDPHTPHDHDLWYFENGTVASIVGPDGLVPLTVSWSFTPVASAP